MTTLTTFDPATGQPARTVGVDDPASVAHRVAAARAAQPAWAARPYAERHAIIARFAGLIRERAELLASILTTDTGKPIAQARNEVRATPARIQWFLDETAALVAPELLAHGGPVPGTRATDELVTWDPLGVVANISAWNYPWFVGTNVFIPALLTGNAVLYKGSEHATGTSAIIAELLAEAGVPADVFASLVGPGSTGAALLDQPVDAVFFTGSYATGVRIARQAAERLMKVQLELGGKDPAYVADDADVASAAAGLADGAFYNAGQSCCAVERIYVHAAVHDAFVEAFLKEVQGFRLGNPRDEATYIGPVSREAQLDVLAGQVADAVAQGATLAAGGARVDRPGWYFAPTVLTGVTHAMQVMRDESFGPIIGIQRVADDAEAVALMNDTPYGLTAAVYSRDRDRAARILAQVNAGSVYWNCCDRVSPRLPWSGRGHSGVGSTLGRPGIRAFVQPRAWHLRTP
ncbi:MAG: aldehyde dehydrogenase family protein [Myxococcales bacterium]|nr:aldehyde dehydrogenase family protein [Myxococcales bacterium]